MEAQHTGLLFQSLCSSLSLFYFLLQSLQAEFFLSSTSLPLPQRGDPFCPPYPELSRPLLICYASYLFLS